MPNIFTAYATKIRMHLWKIGYIRPWEQSTRPPIISHILKFIDINIYFKNVL